MTSVHRREMSGVAAVMLGRACAGFVASHGLLRLAPMLLLTSLRAALFLPDLVGHRCDLVSLAGLLCAGRGVLLAVAVAVRSVAAAVFRDKRFGFLHRSCLGSSVRFLGCGTLGSVTCFFGVDRLGRSLSFHGGVREGMMNDLFIAHNQEPSCFSNQANPYHRLAPRILFNPQPEKQSISSSVTSPLECGCAARHERSHRFPQADQLTHCHQTLETPSLRSRLTDTRPLPVSLP
jgi:hypothetical protein